MKLKNLAIAVALVCGSSLASADVSWVDWTSTTAGTLTVGSSVLNVSLSGNPIGYNNGDYYYNNSSTGFTAASGTYGGLKPSDMIQVNGASQFNLTFSSAIVDPYIALVSVGQGGLPVTYSFTAPFTVLSSGSNYWGYTGYTVSGNNFTGREYNGVLQLHGTFSSLSFSTAPGEFWHGFNIGTGSINAVPEPESYAMLLAGLGLMGAVARRRRR